MQRRFSKTKKGSNRRRKAQKRLAKKHLQISRQRKDFVVKTARALVQTNSLVVYEDLQVRNMVKNYCLAKSISDASWSMFTDWIDHYVKVFNTDAVAVAPHYTSQECSSCGVIVKSHSALVLILVVAGVSCIVIIMQLSTSLTKA